MIGELSLNNIKNLIDRRRLHQAGSKQKQKWEKRIAEHLKIEPHDVIVNKLRRPKSQLWKPKL